MKLPSHLFSTSLAVDSSLVVDSYGNAVEIFGRLDQVVVTGAGHGVMGTPSRTGLTGVGRAIYDGRKWVRLCD